MSAGLLRVVQRLHRHNAALGVRACLALNGGVSAAPWLLGVGGGSASILEIATPYSAGALEEYLGGPNIHKAASGECAAKLARAAYHRCIKLHALGSGAALNTQDPTRFVGVACCAALATSRDRRGTDRCFVATFRPTAVSGGAAVAVHKMLLEKGRDRGLQDRTAAAAVVWAYASACGLDLTPEEEAVVMDEGSMKPAAAWVDTDYSCRGLSPRQLHRRVVGAEEASTRVAAGAARWAVYLRASARGDECGGSSTSVGGATSGAGGAGAGAGGADATPAAHDTMVGIEELRLPPGCIVAPGSFNPAHKGHVLAAAAAARATDPSGGVVPVVFELSVANVDKPTISTEEAARRVAQFTNMHVPVRDGVDLPAAIVTSGVPLFLDKSALYRGCRFMVGYDTAVRIVNTKYYGGSQANMVEALTDIKANGCSFIVVGREVDGAFKTLDDMRSLVPEGLGSLFTAVPEADFRVDISSTELRARAAARVAGDAAETASPATNAKL